MASILKLFGKRLKKFRKTKGLTQEQLAEKAGLHHTFIGAVERGSKNPSLESIAKIAEALGISLRELFPPNRLSSEADNEVAEILDLVQGKSLKDLHLAKTILEDVFSWTKQKS